LYTVGVRGDLYNVHSWKNCHVNTSCIDRHWSW